MKNIDVESPFQINGVLSMTVVNKNGNTVDSFSDKNTITSEGISGLIDLMINENASRVESIYLGTDTGGGTMFSPTEATPDLPSSAQDDIFSISGTNFSLERTSATVLSLSATIIGETIMENNFSDVVTIEFCSATARFGSDKAFAYKRFPKIALTRLVDVIVNWEFEITNCNT